MSARTRSLPFSRVASLALSVVLAAIVAACGVGGRRPDMPWDQVELSIPTKRQLRENQQAIVAIVRCRRAVVASPDGRQQTQIEAEVIEPIRNTTRGTMLSFAMYTENGDRLMDPNRTYALALFGTSASDGFEAIPIRSMDVQKAASRVRVQIGDLP